MVRHSHILGACFGSSDRCSVSDTLQRSSLALQSLEQNSHSAASNVPNFDPVATMHSFCATLNRLLVLSDCDAENIVLSICRMTLVIAADALTTERLED